jgi:DNA-binding MarR family transcriptional regulator
MRVAARGEGCDWVPDKATRQVRSVAMEVVEECLSLALGRARRDLEREYDRLFRPLRLTTAQLRLLSLIALRGPVRGVELARLSGTRRQTVSQSVRRMFAKGWLDVALADDMESAALVTSDDGAAVLLRAHPLWKAAQEKARARLAELLARGG